jgi:uncharacterized protein
LGERDENIFYNWNSLWQLSEQDRAAIAVQKANAHKVDVDSDLIPPAALAKARINQLIEDGTYPGLEAAIEEASASGDAVEEHLESKAEAAEALLAAKQRPPQEGGE